jgi:hypothetical protein
VKAWLLPLSYPGAFTGGGVLSELDQALAWIGAAHWIESFGMGSEAKPSAATSDPDADRGARDAEGARLKQSYGFARVNLINPRRT